MDATKALFELLITRELIKPSLLARILNIEMEFSQTFVSLLSSLFVVEEYRGILQRWCFQAGQEDRAIGFETLRTRLAAVLFQATTFDQGWL